MNRIRDMRYAICDVNPKDSNVYRKMACRLTCDSFGVEYRDGRPYSINIRPLRGHGVVGDGNVETHNNVETHGRASLRHRCPPSPPPPVIAGYDPQSRCLREIAGQARNDGMARWNGTRRVGNGDGNVETHGRASLRPHQRTSAHLDCFAALAMTARLKVSNLKSQNRKSNKNINLTLPATE